VGKLKLTELGIKAIQPGTGIAKHADGNGLLLEVRPSGGKYWRYRFRDAGGKEQYLSLGTYPDVSLAAARKLHQKMREQHKDGVDLAQARRDGKTLAASDARNTFESLARDWHTDNQKTRWTAQHGKEILRRLENHVFPVLGTYPVSSIDAQRVLRCVKAIEGTGSIETAHRCLQSIGQALRWGVQHGRAARDFTPDLRGALGSTGTRNHPRVTLNELPALLRALDGAANYPVTALAIRWLFLTACRTGEMRGATWGEVDLQAKRWTVPKERMKAGTHHIVPLSTQALAVIADIRALGLTSESHEFVFPASQRQARMMSENTIGYCFNRAGYAGRQTPHGIRGLFSTHANESAKWQFNDIELCLAHQTGNEVSRAYNSAQRVPERARLLQWWADELDRMRDGATVLSFTSKSAA
jgi:integrase